MGGLADQAGCVQDEVSRLVLLRFRPAVAEPHAGLLFRRRPPRQATRVIVCKSSDVVNGGGEKSQMTGESARTRPFPARQLLTDIGARPFKEIARAVGLSSSQVMYDWFRGLPGVPKDRRGRRGRSERRRSIPSPQVLT